ncbi:MAG TPA: hypothetical protein VLA49_18910 [Anaerolineales bacterium]|nr:hypothetical protein [Anaerolineales bacterium]
MSAFIYQNPGEYIQRQTQRGKWLFGLTLGLLVASFLFFLSLHFWILQPPTALFPLIWTSVNSKSATIQRALDWGLWGVFGTCVFILTEITKYYRDIEKSSRLGAKKQEYPAAFIEYTPWYITTFIRGPFIALVIMLFFNAANLNLNSADQQPAIMFNFTDLDHRATLLLAFVLGYYHRVARNVLDGIMRRLFARAWAEANEQFTVVPGQAKVVLGESRVFKTDPVGEVVWAASAGTIDQNGKFTAPKEADYSGASLVITASSKGVQPLTSSASVTLVPFNIEGPEEVELMGQANQISYYVTPAQDDLSWKLSPAAGGGSLDTKKGIYTAPVKGTQKTDKIIITASSKKKDSANKDILCSNSLEVTLK